MSMSRENNGIEFVVDNGICCVFVPENHILDTENLELAKMVLGDWEIDKVSNSTFNSYGTISWSCGANMSDEHDKCFGITERIAELHRDDLSIVDGDKYHHLSSLRLISKQYDVMSRGLGVMMFEASILEFLKYDYQVEVTPKESTCKVCSNDIYLHVKYVLMKIHGSIARVMTNSVLPLPHRSTK